MDASKPCKLSQLAGGDYFAIGGAFYGRSIIGANVCNNAHLIQRTAQLLQVNIMAGGDGTGAKPAQAKRLQLRGIANLVRYRLARQCCLPLRRAVLTRASVSGGSQPLPDLPAQRARGCTV